MSDAPWSKYRREPLNAVVTIATPSGEFLLTDDQDIARKRQASGQPTITPDEVSVLSQKTKGTKVDPATLKAIHSVKKILGGTITDDDDVKGGAGFGSRPQRYMSKTRRRDSTAGKSSTDSRRK